MARRRTQRTNSTAASQPGERFRQPGIYLVTMVMLAISLWMLASFIGQVVTSAQLERREAELRAEIAELEAEKLALEQQVAYAESPAYAEQIAREQLGLAREGDIVILPSFPDVTPTPSVPTPEPLPQPTPLPNWRGWQQALFPAHSQTPPSN